MKIKLLSDLHFEFGGRSVFDYPNDENVDVLVLAGDIAAGPDVVLYLKEFCDEYPEVVYVPGNHEYYGELFEGFDARIDNRMQDYRNFHNLNIKEYVQIDKVAFLGNTLWTNFREDAYQAMQAKRCIADFSVIKGFSIQKCKSLYDECLKRIKFWYDYSLHKTVEHRVIVTHFLPARECVHPKYQMSALNSYFANDLGDWIKTLRDTIWMFGHTHDAMDFRIGDIEQEYGDTNRTRMICNPGGYPSEGKNGFLKSKIIEI